MIPARIMDASGDSCIVVTGEPDSYVAVRATGRACEGLDSLFYVEEEGDRTQVIYQVGNGIRYCLTSEANEDCSGRLSLRPCCEDRTDQAFTADEEGGRLMAVDPLSEDNIGACCVAGDMDVVSAAIGEELVHMEKCPRGYRAHLSWNVAPLEEEAITDDAEERQMEEETV
jgi:hypothetical protein